MNLEKIASSGKNLFRKIILASAVTAATLGIAIGCKPVPPPEPDPTNQSLEITVTYSGTARTTLPSETHDLVFALSKDGEGYAVNSFPASLSSLASGHTYNFVYTIAPGDYQLYSNWDWNNDGGVDSFEPRGEPYPLGFNMDGFSTKRINVQLVDRTNPTDPGRVEGIVDYNNLSEDYMLKPLYVTIQDLNYNTVAEMSNYNGTALLPPSAATGKFYYNCTGVPAGGPYRAISFLDVNFSGEYDSNDIRSDFYNGGSVFIVSPGLPTIGIDMVLNNDGTEPPAPSSNTMPFAQFSVTPTSGTTNTNFYFDASLSSDNQDSLGDLLFRWDWEGDYNFDTSYSSNFFASHRYSSPGQYDVELQVKDKGGLVGSVVKFRVINVIGNESEPEPPVSPPEPPPEPPPGQPSALEKILFASFLDSDELEIYSMNEDSSGLRRLTNNSSLDNYPRWSFDRTKIVFVSERDGNPEIYTMNADGSNQQRLTYSSQGEQCPIWSKDGSKIFFEIVNGAIGCINADGSNARRISINAYSFLGD